MKNYKQLQNLEKLLKQKELIEGSYCPFTLELARRSFYEYRKLINKNFVCGWWIKEVSTYLQNFSIDLQQGKKPILIIQAPPQHGKSTAIIDFITWLIGKHPDYKTIYASFSTTLGRRANAKIQRILNSEIYKTIFINPRLPSLKDKTFACNKEMIEFTNGEGSFRNTTVEGSITGESLDLGIIDDPIKGRKDANSTVKRNTAWDWFTDDFFTRFSENAGMLLILTRWHLDDPAGRLIINNPPNLTTLKYSAIATTNEKNRKKGEALFPQLKSLDLIKIRKQQLSVANFEALYQQNPVKMGGEMFKEEWIKYFTSFRQYERLVISCDTGFKEKIENDPSVAGVWGVHSNGFDLLHVYRKRAGYPKLKKDIINLVEEWGNDISLYQSHKLFTIMIEDKASGQSLIQDLRNETNYNILPINPKGSKEIRAETITPQFDAGKVFLLKNAPWLEDYLNELLTFPNSLHDDQVDMTSQFLTYININKSGNITDDLLELGNKNNNNLLW
jgi:predicted phage terminase large subunit-like protein